MSTAPLSSKEGFSVVAPTSVIVPSSMCGRKLSCCARLKRWISSMNSSVPLALLAACLGAVEGFAQILHAGEDGRKLLELELRFVGKQARHRRLAGARRPPENEARQPAALEHARQRAVGADELLLSDDLRKLRRPQPVGERARRPLLKSSGFEQRRQRMVIRTFAASSGALHA